MSHKKLKAKALLNTKTKAAYDELAPEYALLGHKLNLNPGNRFILYETITNK
jgi:hypothetical protein